MGRNGDRPGDQSSGTRDTASGGAILRLALDLPEGKAYVIGLRKTACCLLDSVGVCQEDIEDIELMIGELATNAIIHASEGGGYRVELEYYADHVLIVVTDRGHGFSPAALAIPATPRFYASDEDGEERYGGWGLPLVRSLADHVEIVPALPQGTTVRAERRLRG